MALPCWHRNLPPFAVTRVETGWLLADGTLCPARAPALNSVIAPASVEAVVVAVLPIPNVATHPRQCPRNSLTCTDTHRRPPEIPSRFIWKACWVKALAGVRISHPPQYEGPVTCGNGGAGPSSSPAAPDQARRGSRRGSSPGSSSYRRRHYYPSRGSRSPSASSTVISGSISVAASAWGTTRHRQCLAASTSDIRRTTGSVEP